MVQEVDCGKSIYGSTLNPYGKGGSDFKNWTRFKCFKTMTTTGQ
jgi:hypothetical protein